LEGKDMAKQKTFWNFAREKKPPSPPTFYFCSNKHQHHQRNNKQNKQNKT
jgi:hypothetical protein